LGVQWSWRRMMDDNYIVCQGKLLDFLLVVVLYSQ